MSRAVGGGRRRCQEVWTSSVDGPKHNVNAESRRRQRRFLPGYTASGEEASHWRRRRRCCWRRSSWFGGFGFYRLFWQFWRSHHPNCKTGSRDRSSQNVAVCARAKLLIFSGLRATMGSGSKNAAASAPTATTLAPPLTDPYSWFDYYDKDASNSLDQEEVVTGLLHTIQSAAANKKKTADDSSTVDAIRESIQAIWPAFDIDGNGQVSACGKPSN